MKSQSDQILEALKAGEVLTPLDALDRFGCFRLGARIKDLKGLGHHIVNLEKTGHYARYKLIPPQVPVMPPAFPLKSQVEANVESKSQSLFP
jgi:hypothetical protein